MWSAARLDLNMTGVPTRNSIREQCSPSVTPVVRRIQERHHAWHVFPTMIVIRPESRAVQLQLFFPGQPAPPDVLDHHGNLVVAQPAKPTFAIRSLRGRLDDSIQDPLAGRRYQDDEKSRVG